MTPRWSHGCRRRVWSCWARPTWMSSRWAHPTRPATSARCAIPGTPTGARRLLRRLGGGRRPRGSRRRDRHRHRRLDPPAGGAVRRDRREADLRARVALRHDRLRLEPRSGRRDRRSAADAALVLRRMAGFDPRDSTSVDAPVPDYAAALEYAAQGPEGRTAAASSSIGSGSGNAAAHRATPSR